MKPLPHALARLQAEWDAVPPPPAPPSTALLHPRVTRILPYVLLIGFVALYLVAVLAEAAMRAWG